nr:hypothetical protein [Nanoarchaeum sp.]
MNVAKERSIKINDLFGHYPILSTDVSIHLTPTECPVFYKNRSNGYQHSYFRQGMELINIEAAKLLSFSNGKLTIKDIIEKVYGKGSVTEIAEPIASFFIETEKKQNIVLSKEKCESRKNKITGSLDYYVPYHISVELTSLCNLKCEHCYNDFSKSEINYTSLELIALLNEWKKYGLRGVELTGGEPFLYNGIWDILEYCNQNFDKFALLTNGTLIKKKEAVKLSQYKDKMIMNISLDGSCSKIHDKMRSSGSFEKVINEIKYLVKSGLLMRIAMSVTPDNIFDLENTIKLAKYLGVKYFSWSPIAPFGRGDKLAWSWDPSKAEEIGKLEARMFEEYKGFITVLPEAYQGMIDKIENCGFGFKNIVLSPSGKVRPCLFLPEDDSIGNLRKESLEQIFKNPILKYFRNIKLPSPVLCSGCKYQEYCRQCIVKPLKAIEREGRLCVWAHTFQIAYWLARFQKYKFDPQRPVFSWN